MGLHCSHAVERVELGPDPDLHQDHLGSGKSRAPALASHLWAVPLQRDPRAIESIVSAAASTRCVLAVDQMEVLVDFGWELWAPQGPMMSSSLGCFELGAPWLTRMIVAHVIVFRCLGRDASSLVL